MYDETRQLMPGFTLEAEYAALNGLISECMAFEEKWNTFEPWKSGASPEAVIAVSELHTMLHLRRLHILKKLDTSDLPF